MILKILYMYIKENLSTREILNTCNLNVEWLRVILTKSLNLLLNVRDSTHSYTTLRASPYSDGIIHSRESRTTRRFLCRASSVGVSSSPPLQLPRAECAPLRWAATVSAWRPRETATQKKAIYPLRLLLSGVGIAIFQERTTSRLHNPKCTPQARRSPSIKLQFFFTRKFSIIETAVLDPSRNLTSHLFMVLRAGSWEKKWHRHGHAEETFLQVRNNVFVVVSAESVTCVRMLTSRVRCCLSPTRFADARE